MPPLLFLHACTRVCALLSLTLSSYQFSNYAPLILTQQPSGDEMGQKWPVAVHLTIQIYSHDHFWLYQQFSQQVLPKKY